MKHPKATNLPAPYGSRSAEDREAHGLPPEGWLPSHERQLDLQDAWREMRPQGFPKFHVEQFSRVKAVSELLDAPTVTQPQKILRRLLDDFREPPCITLLTGKRGTGKTQMGVAAALRWGATKLREARRSRRHNVWPDMLYRTAVELWSREKDSWSRKRSAFEDAFSKPVLTPLRHAEEAGFLVLDEVHEACEDGTAPDWLVNLIDARYRNAGITLLLANWSNGAEAAKALGHSAWDRIRETGEVIECLWLSYREPDAIVETIL